MSDFETVPVGTVKMLEQVRVESDDAKEQYRDILSEYNTLRQSHSRIMDRMYEGEVERDALESRLEEVTEERNALEMERDHLVMAVEEYGLKIGSHGSGLCLTDRSLAQIKAKWQAEVLEEFGNTWDWERQPNHKDLRHAAYALRSQAKGGE